MSEPGRPWPVKPVVSLIAVRREAASRALALLAAWFGPPDLVGPWLPFQQTDYYTPEMGAGLERCLASFLHLANPELLPDWKLATNRVEHGLSLGGRRLVNVDIGYVTPERLVLATGKNYRHRLALSLGIYGEATLMVEHGRFAPQPWTYPDYAGQEMLGLLEAVRRKYLWQLRMWRKVCSGA
jgi:hypothetical protein